MNKDGVNRYQPAGHLAGMGLLLLAFVFSGWDAIGQEPDGQPASGGPPGIKLSARSEAFLRARWDSNSYEAGMTIVKDPSEDESARKMALDKTASGIRRMQGDKLAALESEVTRIAKDASEPAELSAQAIRHMAASRVLMVERGLAGRDVLSKDKQFLVETALDEKVALTRRAASILAVDTMGLEEAVEDIRPLLWKPQNVDKPEIASSVVLALVHLRKDSALQDIKGAFEKTSNESVFGTCGYALGQIHTEESMATLVHNCERFPNTGACDFALVDMEEVITRCLKDPTSQQLPLAIKATKYLWKDGQKERYLPLLKSLTVSGPQTTRKEALKRIIEVALEMPFDQEKALYAEILPGVEGQGDLKSQTDFMKRRVTARLIQGEVSQEATASE